MINNNFYIIMMVSIFCLSSQVYSQNTGIGTTNPQAKLHIDGSSNNSTTGVPSAAQQADDFVVLSTGNIGVGTTAPSVKLEVKSTGTVAVPKTAIKINDGTEAAGKTLTSDANGNTSWQYIAMNEIQGVLSRFGISIPLDVKTYYITSSYIDLEPGKWKVNVTMLLRTTDKTLPDNAWSWVRSTFSEGSNSTTMSTDVEKPSYVSGMYKGSYEKFALLTGAVIINNKSAAKKRYFYIVGNTESGNTGSPGAIKFEAVGSTAYSENIITASPVL